MSNTTATTTTTATATTTATTTTNMSTTNDTITHDPKDTNEQHTKEVESKNENENENDNAKNVTNIDTSTANNDDATHTSNAQKDTNDTKENAKEKEKEKEKEKTVTNTDTTTATTDVQKDTSNEKENQKEIENEKEKDKDKEKEKEKGNDKGKENSKTNIPTPSSSAIPHIVIFGGGFAGAKLFLELAKKVPSTKAEITLINQSPYLFYDVAVPRCMVDPVSTPIEKLLYPLTNLVQGPHQHVVVGTIDEIHAHHAVVSRAMESGPANTAWYQAIPSTYLLPSSSSTEQCAVKFDYGILALGSHYTFPGKWPSLNKNAYHEEGGAGSAQDESKTNQDAGGDGVHVDALVHQFQTLQSNIKNASKILVIGGGPVGIEMAGEIKSAFPQKSVTLASHSLFSLSPAFNTKLTQKLQKKNIPVVLTKKIDLQAILTQTKATSFPIVLPHAIPIAVSDDPETRIDADLILKATGVQPQTGPIKLPNALNEQGWVHVTPTLQLPSFPHLFAIGDTIDQLNTKFAFVAMQHADLVAEHLVKLVKQQHPVSSDHQGNTKTVKLKAFSPPPPMCILALGSDDGVSQIPLLGTFLGGSMAKMFKGDGGFMTARRFFGPSLLDSKNKGTTATTTEQ